MRNVVLLLGLIGLWSVSASAATFYGADKLQHVPRTRGSAYFIQVGSFKYKSYALEAKKKYLSYGFPIRIVRHGKMYAVVIGPISNQSFRGAGSRTAKPPRHAVSVLPAFFQHKPQKASTYVSSIPRHPRYVYAKQMPSNANWSRLGERPLMKKRHLQANRDARPMIDIERWNDKTLDKDGQWYIEVEGGVLFQNLPSTMTVLNGSPYKAPYNVDSFSISQSTERASIIANVGRSMPIGCYFISRFDIGLRYQYLPAKDITGTITQYSIPEFLNYNYSWGTDANILTADLKLNFDEWHSLSPYFNGGVGYSINGASLYTETPIYPVTPRYSPAFTSKSNGHFSFHVGAGLDYTITPAWRVSVGYEYLNLGKYQSGYGVDTWSAERLDLGHYNANSALIGLTYLLG